MQLSFLKNKSIVDLLLATVILLGAAFFNGYPLVYSDTGTYVSSGFEMHLPDDRPIAYGLFIRATSLGWSLWLTVIAQCYILAWLLRVLLLPLLGEQGFRGRFLIILTVISTLTALPWYAGQLMPDIFTAMQLIIITVVCTHSQISRWRWAIFSALFILCCIVHFSNLFIGLFSVITYAISARKKVIPGTPAVLRRAAIVGTWCLVSFIVMPALNWIVARDFSLGKGGYTFIMGRMVDSGMLKMYLDDQCESATEPYRLCQYKDSLPENSRKFHWDQSSPLYKEGGWGVPEKEYRAIVWGTLTNPKFIGLHIWESLLATPGQLMQNAIGSGLDYGWYRSPESPPYQAVMRYFPLELNEYNASRQTGNIWKQDLDFILLNKINFWVLLFTAMGVIWMLYMVGGNDLLTTTLRVLLIGILVNAFITANLAVICDRFSPRVVWLLTLCVAIGLWRKFEKYLC